MTREELLSRIWIDPKRCFGKPCIRGHRIWVSLVLDLLSGGMSEQEILEDYPGLEHADILHALPMDRRWLVSAMSTSPLKARREIQVR